MTDSPRIPPPPYPPPDDTPPSTRFRAHAWNALGLVGRAIRAWREWRSSGPSGTGLALTSCVIGALSLAHDMQLDDSTIEDLVGWLPFW